LSFANCGPPEVPSTTPPLTSVVVTASKRARHAPSYQTAHTHTPPRARTADRRTGWGYRRDVADMSSSLPRGCDSRAPARPHWPTWHTRSQISADALGEGLGGAEKGSGEGQAGGRGGGGRGADRKGPSWHQSAPDEAVVQEIVPAPLLARELPRLSGHPVWSEASAPGATFAAPFPALLWERRLCEVPARQPGRQWMM
jgi:hypothetical protein